MNQPSCRPFTRRHRVLTGIALLLFATAPLRADGEVVLERIASEEHDFRVVRLAEGLDHPWAVAFLPDDRRLVSERPGRLLLFDGNERTELEGLPPIHAQGQGGLLDVVPHPEFGENGLIYFTYSSGDRREATVALGRARLDDERLTDVEELFVADAWAGSGRHFGSRLAFMPDGTLLMTVGDRGDDEYDPDSHRSQDRGNHVGTTLRLTADGDIPDDNPFVDEPGVAPAIYSWGHRNSQGMVVDEDGRVWQTEHGPRGGDEFNRVRPGLNYGWPVVSHGVHYRTGKQVGEGRTAPGMEPPLTHWTPSPAPSGLARHTGEPFTGWRGDFFAGHLAGEALRRVVVDGAEVVHKEVLLEGRLGRIRDVRAGPDGYLYLLTDAADGALYRLEPVD
ncbi:MAG: PQQ-dependent sugar dehydrogenase [Thiohalospira sp.]